MSNKIPTAAEKLMDLKTYFKRHTASDGKEALNGYALWEDIPQVMKDFAQLHVEAALKAASDKATILMSEDGNKSVEVGQKAFMREESYEINKKSILSAYPKENIK